MLRGSDSLDDDRGETGGGDGRRVLFKPLDMQPNAKISAAVWSAFDAMPSQTLPRRAARPVRRLSALAQALSRDGLKQNAIAQAYQELIDCLDGLAVRYRAQLDEHENAILEVHGEIIVAGVGESRVTTVGTFSEFADDRSVDAVYRDARKVLTPELARRYVEHLAADDDELFDAEVKVSALARIAEVAGRH